MTPLVAAAIVLDNQADAAVYAPIGHRRFALSGALTRHTAHSSLVAHGLAGSFGPNVSLRASPSWTSMIDRDCGLERKNVPSYR